jgi:hypothetical protein
MTSSTSKTASEQIDAIIAKYADWRGEKLARIRTLIQQADPEVIEEVKWKKPSNPDGIPVWSHDGILCMGETYTKHLRLTFAKGPSLHDPNGLINSYRAMIIHEEDTIDEAAFKDLIHAAVELNHKTKKNK